MTHPSVTIQITPESMPSTPIFLGEVAVFAQVLIHTGILKKIQDQVRFARARFRTYDLIDFVAVLIGYALSGEPTLLAFYERLAPFAEPFMALFGRQHLPHRSTLSRFSPLLISLQERRFAHSFKRICSLVNRLPPPVDCGIGRKNSG